jgi:hypothetical protein
MRWAMKLEPFTSVETKRLFGQMDGSELLSLEGNDFFRLLCVPLL